MTDRAHLETLTAQADALARALHDLLADTTPPPAPTPRAPDPTDRLLKVGKAAELLQVAPKWLYVHADALPFVRRIGRRSLRISEAGLRAWMAKR